MAKKKIKPRTDYRIVITAILALVGLEIAAMYHGINGKFFATIVAIIAALGGWSMPQLEVK